MSKSRDHNCHDLIKEVAVKFGMSEDLVEQFLLDKMLKDLGSYVRAKKKVEKILIESLKKASQ